MALTRLYSFLTGSVVTNTIITGEFDNIYNNALTLISPLTGNLAAGGNSITGLSLGSAALPSLQYTGDTNTGIYSSGADAVDFVGGGLRLMTLTSTPAAGIVSINPGAISATAATNVGRLFVGGTSALTIPAGVTAIAAGVFIAEPNFTATGTITDAVTLYVAGAPSEGASNYAILVATGNVRFDGLILCGDNSNASMTAGLTLNQGGNDDEILALKSADVAHGITNFTETDTFAECTKLVAASGGLRLSGYAAAGGTGVQIRALAVTDNTTKSTLGRGYIELNALKKSGVGDVAPGTDANMVVFRDGSTPATRFIFDVEGSAHADIEWTAFQDHDDVTLLKNFERERRKGGHATGAPASPDLQELISLGIVAPDSVDAQGQPARGLVNMTRLQMLQAGAVRQAHDVVDVLLDDLLARRPLTPQERARIPVGIRQRRGL